MGMTKEQLREYNYSRDVLGPLGFTDADLDTLHRWEARLHTISEQQCNGFQDWRGNWDQAASDAADKREESIERKVTALVESKGLTVSFNGDPRGGAIRLHLPADADGHKRYNSWDGETWGIFW